MFKKIVESNFYRLTIGFILLGVLVIGVRGFLGPVFAGEEVLPQSFTIGFLTIHYYGIILALAIFVARWIALRRAEQYGFTKEKADQIIFVAIIAGVLGARLYHVVSELKYYIANPQLVFVFWRGGLSVYGALLGGAGALAFYAWKDSKLSNRWFWSKFLNYLNWLTFSFLAGQVIGRFGNLFNYEAFGGPTSLPWKMFVPVSFRPPEFILNGFFHPWFLYESLANLVIFFVLLYWKRGSSRLFLWYVLLYNIVRLMLEFLRVDSTFIGQFRLNVIVSIGLALVASIVLIKYKNGFKLNNTGSSTTVK